MYFHASTVQKDLSYLRNRITTLTVFIIKLKAISVHLMDFYPFRDKRKSPAVKILHLNSTKKGKQAIFWGLPLV